MCKKEKKDKKEKKAKKAKSSGAGASAAQCTLKLVEEHKDLLSPLLSAPSRPPAATARPACLPACPPACLPACHACHAYSSPPARRVRLAVSFPPGLLPAERLSNDEETGMRLELRRNTAGNKRHQYELRAETSTMSYSANNYGPQLFPRNEGPKLLIGVHDKRTGVVRLVAAQQLYQMKTLVKQPRLPLDPPAPDPVKLVGAEAGRAMQEGRRALVSELGSAKAHKKQKSQLAKQISPDAVFSSANLTSDLVGLVQVEAPKPLTPQQARPLHPRFNLSATTPTEVYPREGLIPERAWSLLDVTPVGHAGLEPQTSRAP